MLVKDTINHCSTKSTYGLNSQIVALLVLNTNLVKVNHHMLQVMRSHDFPYLQANAVNTLILAALDRDKPLVINSCLRTIVQQHILHQQCTRKICGIKAASIPPNSKHQSGLAIDIEDAIAWRPYLKKYGWQWLGSFDPMHFDYINIGSANLGKLQVIAFQKLWNHHNPKNLVTVDGIWGNQTAIAVNNSPVNGW